MSFTLAAQLKRDCYHLGTRGTVHVLLNRNALFPWFILVPECHVTEFYQLDGLQQSELIKQVNDLSAFVTTSFRIDKLNIATIGNVVSQMHIHIVGRTRTDPCWPGVVWGTSNFAPYKEEDVDKIRAQLVAAHLVMP